MKERITVNFDGGSRGNPGVAGIGVVLSAEDGTALVTLGKYIGRATNNVAEYMALIIGLREAKKFGAKKLLIRGDSELVIKQMRGEYRVKNPGLKDLNDQAAALVREFEDVKFEHNFRHHNSIADKLANLAMDRKIDVTETDGADEPASPPPRATSAACPECGCKIEIRILSRTAPDGHFTCPCGTRME
jgi:ribonuclease HI